MSKWISVVSETITLRFVFFISSLCLLNKLLENHIYIKYVKMKLAKILLNNIEKDIVDNILTRLTFLPVKFKCLHNRVQMKVD